MPRERASANELDPTLAALLDWIVKARLADLLEAGLNHTDAFKLVRVADDYRKGEFGRQTLATIQDLAGKLDQVALQHALS